MYVVIQNKVKVRAIISTQFDSPFSLMNNKLLLEHKWSSE